MVIETFDQSDEETWLYDFEHFEYFLYFDYIDYNSDDWEPGFMTIFLPDN